jgi:phenylacetate-coenzyme A ligase PaaK-like adenylate-forming protein
MIRESQAAIPEWKFSQDYHARSLKALDTALARVAVYNSWRSLDPGAGYPVDSRFAAMPALTKKDIREHFPKGILPRDRDISRGLAGGEIELVDSSGAVDDKITNIWNQSWWDASEKSSWKLNSHIDKIATGDHREAILANPRNVGFISDNIDLPMEKRRLSRFLYLNEKTDPLSWSPAHMDRMIEELNTFQPAVLEANPSYLARLCRYIAAHSKKVFQPGIIVFTYEYPANLHYRQIRRVFPVPTASSYGTTETGYVFMQCGEGKYHQNSEFCRVDFQPLKPDHGGPLAGRILVTPFQNPWSYIVRFDVGDLVCLEESGKCPCGVSSGLILSSINGRKANVTLSCAGRLVTLFELDNAVSALEDVDEYKLIQIDAGTYELHLASERPDKQRLSAEAKQILKKLYGESANVSVVHESAIAPESSGKYLISRALFPIELEDYLEPRYIGNKT